MSFVKTALSCIVMATLTGCASLVAPVYAPDYEVVDALKKHQPGKLAVGEVQPRDPEAPVNAIKLRGARLQAPRDSFAQYLEDALVHDLREIAVFDQAADTRLEATLLKNDIDVSGIRTGTGTMEVAIVVSRRGERRLDKTYAARTEFESSFAGAVAVPKGQSEYQTLVRTLLAAVYADPAFIAAIKQ